jgi:hypothetical protein
MFSCEAESGVEVDELRVFFAGGGIGSTSSVVFRIFLPERFDSDGEGLEELISDAFRLDLVEYIEPFVSCS